MLQGEWQVLQGEVLLQGGWQVLQGEVLLQGRKVLQGEVLLQGRKVLRGGEGGLLLRGRGVRVLLGG